ncbi:MAG: lysylphosphatidylglycerol synthase transmembrane domain-containing protein [Actinomycetota bacterium]
MRRFHRRSVLVAAGIAAILYAGALVFALNRLELPPFGVVAWLIVGSAALVQMAAKWMFGMQFRHGLAENGTQLHPRQAFRAALVGAGVARLIPAGGAITPVAMSWMVRREARSAGGAAVRATVLNYAGLLIGTGFALLWVINRGLYESLEAGTWVIGVVALLIGLLLMFGTRWIGLAARRLPKWLAELIGPPAESHVPDAQSQMWLWARLALEAVALFLAMQAFGIHLTPMQTFAAFGVSQMVGGLPGTPGGIGFAEAGLVAALAAVGFPAEITVAPTLVYRVVSYWLPAIAGLVAGGSSFLRAETT